MVRTLMKSSFVFAHAKRGFCAKQKRKNWRDGRGKCSEQYKRKSVQKKDEEDEKIKNWKTYKEPKRAIVGTNEMTGLCTEIGKRKRKGRPR